MTPAEALAQAFKEKYNLTYRCSVNLEATINNMFHAGLTTENIVDIIEDIYDHYEEVNS